MFSRPLVKFLIFLPVLVSISLLYAKNLYANNNDPLNKSEIDKVIALIAPVNSHNSLASRPSLHGKTFFDKKSVNSNLAPKQELLLVERHEQKNASQGQRLADVFVYDYNTNELIESLVDLNTSRVLKSKRKQGIQLPLTENELDHAKQIIFADEDERRILEDEYLRITSRQLSNISELNIKAFVFTANSMPNRVNEASKLCGIQRCAQLMLYTQENIVFEISPIINLSENIVTQHIGF